VKLVRAFEKLCGGFFWCVYTDVYRRYDQVRMYNSELGIANDGFEKRTTTYYSVMRPRLKGLLKGRFNVVSYEMAQVHSRDCEKPYQELVIVRHDTNKRMARIKLREMETWYKQNKHLSRAPRQPFSKRHSQ
jgi:hypothetical protein